MKIDDFNLKTKVYTLLEDCANKLKKLSKRSAIFLLNKGLLKLIGVFELAIIVFLGPEANAYIAQLLDRNLSDVQRRSVNQTKIYIIL